MSAIKLMFVCVAFLVFATAITVTGGKFVQNIYFFGYFSLSGKSIGKRRLHHQQRRKKFLFQGILEIFGDGDF